MHAMINPYIVFLTCSVLLMMRSEFVWAFGEGSNFQLVREPQNWILRHFQAEGAVWAKLLLRVVLTLKLPICPFSGFGDCNTRRFLPLVTLLFSAVGEEGLLNLWKGRTPAVLRHVGRWYPLWWHTLRYDWFIPVVVGSHCIVDQYLWVPTC